MKTQRRKKRSPKKEKKGKLQTEINIIESVREINDSPGRRSMPMTKILVRSSLTKAALVGITVGDGSPGTRSGTRAGPSCSSCNSTSATSAAAASTGFTERVQSSCVVRKANMMTVIPEITKATDNRKLSQTGNTGCRDLYKTYSLINSCQQCRRATASRTAVSLSVRTFIYGDAPQRE